MMNDPEMPTDEAIARRIDFQLRQLEVAHARAHGPTRRRKIEVKAAELRRELEDLREQAKVVDIEYARWVCRFNEMMGER
jgi:hypothetical protein